MAIGIAKEMKDIFKDKLDLKIYTMDSEEAKKYNFKSSTNMVLDGERLHIKTALDSEKVKNLIQEKLARQK
ncbi:hypothetical protein JCM13304A_23980 [Desulfothermus okinawensis JCM 13304]